MAIIDPRARQLAASRQATDRPPSHYGGAGPEAIRHHYDAGDAFYGLWLDPSLTYSCAMWRDPDESLAVAQRRKLDFLIEAAGAPGAARVLDVGCGWGGLMRRMLDAHAVKRVVGLTLSGSQAAAISRWAPARCEVRLEGWERHDPHAPYDAIISCEAFEHFARFGQPRPERVASYRRFFERCAGWLPVGGKLVIQTGVKGSNARMERTMARDLLFVVERIFPESVIPWASEVIEASERLFELQLLRNDPEDYVRTCAAWQARLQRSCARARDLLGEEKVADYERYLRTAHEAYKRRHLGLARMVFERV